LFTAFYSFRLIYLSFLREIQSSKPVTNQIHESPALITIPLASLAIGSIFLGYCTKDIFVGVGSSYLDHVVLILPDRNALYLAEFLPFTIKNIPLFFGILSLLLVFLAYQLLRH
jgi:NADH:ubiquinone oxidoreductase subunit 5 (subunit L)/multisubunit Na+/H+ antiporter MnhA subunit